MLPDVVRGLRVLPTSTTGFSPFQLVYKQEPTLPVPLMLKANDLQECPFTMEDHAPQVFKE